MIGEATLLGVIVKDLERVSYAKPRARASRLFSYRVKESRPDRKQLADAQ